MDWHYADGNNQVGPIPDDELTRLVAAGTIRDETLVWRDGMADWTSYGQVRGTAPAATADSPEGLRLASAVDAVAPVATAGVAPGRGTCRGCGQTYSLEDLADFGGTLICGRCKPAYLQRIREGGAMVGDMQYAGFWIRVAAKIIDGIIAGIASIIIMFLTIGVGAATGSEDAQIGAMVLYYVLALGLSITYYVWFHGKHGATPGKMACGIKVVTAEGDPITYGRSFGRFFADMLSGILLYIGYIMAGFDSQKRALHDHICNTRVIKKA